MDRHLQMLMNSTYARIPYETTLQPPCCMGMFLIEQLKVSQVKLMQQQAFLDARPECS